MTDLGGNRVDAGTHAINLSLASGAGTLRGPKVRYTRRGVAHFGRLRIAAPGYDKVLRASSAGLTDGLSASFGVLPNGIPHALRFATSPNLPVHTGVQIAAPTVSVEILDVYGERIVTPPIIALAPCVLPPPPPRRPVRALLPPTFAACFVANLLPSRPSAPLAPAHAGLLPRLAQVRATWRAAVPRHHL